MDSEMMVAVVGGGAALLGAAVGGTAAVVSASIQGKRTAEAARSAYQGALDVARRTAQQQAYTRLLSEANAYATATYEVLLDAFELIDDRGAALSGDEPSLSPETREQFQTRIDEANNPAQLNDAVRYVGLEGPEIVYRAAKEVQTAATDLWRILRNLEETIDHGEGHLTMALHRTVPHLSHGSLQRLIDEFADTASAHLNNGGR